MLPQDSDTRRTASKARQIVHSKIDTEHWEYKEETGNDVGRDCIIELSENGVWYNHKIECQIKGTTVPKYIYNDTFISFPFPVKTLNYALGSPISFVLFVVDVNEGKVYFQCIQDYCKNNKDKISKIKPDQETHNININVKNVLNDNDIQLQELAKKFHPRN